jgi:hypothetical protein
MDFGLAQDLVMISNGALSKRHSGIYEGVLYSVIIGMIS